MEHILKGIVDSVTQGIIYQESDGKILYSNQAAQRIFGFSVGEAHRHTTPDLEMNLIFENGSSCPREEHPFETTLRTGQGLEGQIRGVVRQDQPVSWFSINTRPVFEPGFDTPSAVVMFFTDITDQKEVRAKQAGDFRRCAMAMDLAKLVHWEYDIAADLFTFDDQFFDLYGTTSTEQGGNRMPAGEYARRFLPPEDIPLVSKEIQMAIEATDPNFISNLEHRIIRADGEERYVNVRYGLIKDEAGRTIKTYGANQDITDRKRVEMALRESELSFKATLDGLPINIALLDDKGHILLVNQAWRDFALQNNGDPAGCCEGVDYLAVCEAASGVSAEGADSFAKGIREVLSGEKSSFSLKYSCHSPNKKRWFSGWVTKFPGDGPRRAVVSHEDISGHKLAEELLLQSEERFALAVDGTRDGLWDWNLVTGEAYHSERYSRMLGYEPEEIPATSAAWAEFLYPDDREGALARLQGYLDGKVKTI